MQNEVVNALEYGKFVYTVTKEETVTITGYTDTTVTTLTIPSVIDEKPVTAIGASAFATRLRGAAPCFNMHKFLLKLDNLIDK